MHTHKHVHIHAHASRWGQSCKRSGWHCGTSLAALCRCRLHTGFWINGFEMIYRGYLPPEHRHTHPCTAPHIYTCCYTHTHTAQTSSLSHCSYGDADAKAQTKTKRGNERNLAQRHPFVSLLTEYLRRVDMLRCSLNSYLVIYTHLLSDVMETVAEVTLTIANPPTTCSTSTISKISRWNARLHSNRKRRSYRRSSV